jgi:type II secretory pathway pseudopilin PulG
MTHRPAQNSRAFTLAELVLVLVLISTALAIAAPSLGGWRRGQRLRDAGEEFLSIARHGRALAVANAQIHRLYIDPASGSYWLMAQEGQQFVELGNSFGRRFALPDGYQLVMTRQEDRTPLEFVEFYPSGRMQPPASVVITADDGGTYVLESPSPAEGLIVPPTGQAVPR